MIVLGAGIGLCMQVLTIIVQNTADYRDLGVATSGVTFFRTLGSSFGAAIFGTIYTNVLEHTLPGALAADPGLDPAHDRRRRRTLHAHPAAQIAPIVDAYSHALHVVFLAAVPVAARRVRPGAVLARGAAARYLPRTAPPTSATASACPSARRACSCCRRR